MGRYSLELLEKICVFWTKYYRSVGLDDIDASITWRLDEESIESKRVSELEMITNYSVGQGQKHIVVGTVHAANKQLQNETNANKNKTFTALIVLISDPYCFFENHDEDSVIFKSIFFLDIRCL